MATMASADKRVSLLLEPIPTIRVLFESIAAMHDGEFERAEACFTRIQLPVTSAELHRHKAILTLLQHMATHLAHATVSTKQHTGLSDAASNALTRLRVLFCNDAMLNSMLPSTCMGCQQRILGFPFYECLSCATLYCQWCELAHTEHARVIQYKLACSQ